MSDGHPQALASRLGEGGEIENGCGGGADCAYWIAIKAVKNEMSVTNSCRGSFLTCLYIYIYNRERGRERKSSGCLLLCAMERSLK